MFIHHPVIRRSTVNQLTVQGKQTTKENVRHVTLMKTVVEKFDYAQSNSTTDDSSFEVLNLNTDKS
jgi:hypothetical protein